MDDEKHKRNEFQTYYFFFKKNSSEKFAGGLVSMHH